MNSPKMEDRGGYDEITTPGVRSLMPDLGLSAKGCPESIACGLHNDLNCSKTNNWEIGLDAPRTKQLFSG